MILIEILVGLPGSGKTYYASHQKDIMTGHDVRHVDCDSILDTEMLGTPGYTLNDNIFIVRSHIEDAIRQRVRGWDHWVFDGLFLSRKNQDLIVWSLYNTLLKQPGRPTKGEPVTIRFVFFKEDRETCLFNDSFRPKERQAFATIKCAKMDKPDIEMYREKYPQFQFELVERDIHKMNYYERIFKPHETYYEDEMRSDTWSLGGTWANCWGSGGGIPADPVPKNFDKFDELMKEICPNITHFQYKDLVEASVAVEEGREYDYYGGCEHFGYFKCDLKKLYNKMIEMNLIKED